MENTPKLYHWHELDGDALRDLLQAELVSQLLAEYLPQL